MFSRVAFTEIWCSCPQQEHFGTSPKTTTLDRSSRLLDRYIHNSQCSYPLPKYICWQISGHYRYLGQFVSRCLMQMFLISESRQLLPLSDLGSWGKNPPIWSVVYTHSPNAVQGRRTTAGIIRTILVVCSSWITQPVKYLWLWRQDCAIALGVLWAQHGNVSSQYYSNPLFESAVAAFCKHITLPVRLMFNFACT